MLLNLLIIVLSIENFFNRKLFNWTTWNCQLSSSFGFSDGLEIKKRPDSLLFFAVRTSSNKKNKENESDWFKSGEKAAMTFKIYIWFLKCFSICSIWRCSVIPFYFLRSAGNTKRKKLASYLIRRKRIAAE